MHLLVHDYGGYAFPLELSRWLAGQGHRVAHLYSRDAGAPQGRMAATADDPTGLSVTALGEGRPLPKYQLARRLLRERAYGRRLAEAVARERPDAVLSANTPPLIQRRLHRTCRRLGIPLVWWLQDIFTPVLETMLRRTLPAPFRPAAGIAAALFRPLEFGALARAEAVVAITEDFVPLLTAGGVAAERISVIPNWAPLSPRPAPADAAAWRTAHGIAPTGEETVFLYAGTLGLKHNPALLADLAARFAGRARVVVASQGAGRAWLEARKADRGEALNGLLLLDYQPPEQLPAMLAAADVAVAILEPYAGALSVPSKVLTCLAAGRPLLASLPGTNRSARVLREAEAGAVVEPTDTAAFLAAAEALWADAEEREAAGRRARAYAETHFAPDHVTPRFIETIGLARGHRS